MTRQAILLRGVNVGGRKLAMADLKRVCESAGCTDVKTLLASGNAVLDAKEKGEKLEAKLEAALAKDLSFKTDIYVRNAADLAAIIAANPFPDMAKDDPSHLVVLFMREAPNAAHKTLIETPQGGPEQARVIGREIFVTYPASIGRSKFKLKAEGTMRNWNTVLKLAAMLAPTT